MFDGKIQELDPSEDLSKLKVDKYGWDLVIDGRPYQVVRVDGRVHSIGGRYINNDLYCYRLDIEKPEAKDLTPFNGHAPAWGIHVDEGNRYKDSYFSGTEWRGGVGGYISRNGEPFVYQSSNDIGYLLAALQVKLTKLQEHPINFSERNWRENLIGRKVWYRDDKAVVSRICDGVDLILMPEEGGCFHSPKWSLNDPDMPRPEKFCDSVKVDVFDADIWWFRK